MFMPARERFFIHERDDELYKIIIQSMTYNMLSIYKSMIHIGYESGKYVIRNMNQIKQKLDKIVVSEIDVFYGVGNDFIEYKLLQLKDLLESEELFVPDLFQEYLIMKVLFSTKNDYGKSFFEDKNIIQKIRFRYLVRRFVKDHCNENVYHTYEGFETKRKMIDHMIEIILYPAKTWNYDYFYNLGFTLWDNDYMWFTEYGFIAAIHKCDSAMGESCGYGGEFVRKMLAYNGFVYPSKSNESIVKWLKLEGSCVS